MLKIYIKEEKKSLEKKHEEIKIKESLARHAALREINQLNAMNMAWCKHRYDRHK